MPAKKHTLSPAASTSRQKRKPPATYKFGGRPPRINEISRHQPDGQDGLSIGETIPYLIEEGMTMSGAAALCGIFPTTLQDWQRRGMNEIARMATEQLEEPAETECPFVALVWGCTQAEAVLQNKAIAAWQKHWPKDWRSVQAFMAKRFKDEWGETSKVELTGANGGAIRVAAEVPSLDQVEVQIAQAEAQLAETKRTAIETREVAQ